VVADLPTDAVAVVVARDYAADRKALTVLEEKAAGIVAVEIAVVLAIAIQGNVFDGDIADVLSGDDREKTGDSGVVDAPEVVAQRPVQLEAVPGAGHQRAFQDDLSATALALGAEADTVPESETGGILKGDLLVEPIAVRRELGGDRGFLEKD